MSHKNVRLPEREARRRNLTIPAWKGADKVTRTPIRSRIAPGRMTADADGGDKAAGGRPGRVSLAVVALNELGASDVVNFVMLVTRVGDPAASEGHDAAPGNGFSPFVEIAQFVGDPSDLHSLRLFGDTTRVSTPGVVERFARPQFDLLKTVCHLNCDLDSLRAYVCHVPSPFGECLARRVVVACQDSIDSPTAERLQPDPCMPLTSRTLSSM
jgi:hypothetical protein